MIPSVVAGAGGGTNLYYAAESGAPAGLTFYVNSGQFATGGGWVVDPFGGHGNFGFNARYSKPGSPKGQIVYVYRGLYTGPCTIDGVKLTCTNVPATWVIKSNAITGLAFKGSTYPITSTLQGKASLSIYRTSDGTSLFGAGNAKFTATVVDSGKSSGIGFDTFALTVFDSRGVLFKSVPTTLLGGGNVVVHQK